VEAEGLAHAVGRPAEGAGAGAASAAGADEALSAGEEVESGAVGDAGAGAWEPPQAVTSHAAANAWTRGRSMGGFKHGGAA
jgi:hypothetical protein